MKAKIYIGAKKYALYIGRKIVDKTLEFLTLPARFISNKVQDLKNLTMWGQSLQTSARTRNLYDKDSIPLNAYATSNGIFTHATSKTWVIEVKPNTTYTLSYDNSMISLNPRCAIVGFENKPSVGSTDATSYYINNNATKHTVTFTTGNNINYIALWIVHSLGVDGIQEALSTAQLEEGNTATPYVPYIATTPTPDTPIPVESVGDKTKNLFDENNEGIVYGSNINASGAEASSTMNSSTYYIEVKPNTDYTVGFINIAKGSVTRYHLYDANKTWLQQIKTNSSGAIGRTETVNFTTTSDTQYLKFTMRGTSALEIKDAKIQLEEGDTATSYEPYGYKVPVTVGDTTTNIYLNEPLRKVGEYADTLSVDGTNVTVVRNVEVIDETGTKTIEESLIHKVPSTTETYTIENPINLPQGTLTIDTDTNIKPSKIEITGDIDNDN